MYAIDKLENRFYEIYRLVKEKEPEQKKETPCSPKPQKRIEKDQNVISKNHSSFIKIVLLFLPISYCQVCILYRLNMIKSVY